MGVIVEDIGGGWKYARPDGSATYLATVVHELCEASQFKYTGTGDEKTITFPNGVTTDTISFKSTSSYDMSGLVNDELNIFICATDNNFTRPLGNTTFSVRTLLHSDGVGYSDNGLFPIMVDVPWGHDATKNDLQIVPVYDKILKKYIDNLYECKTRQFSTGDIIVAENGDRYLGLGMMLLTKSGGGHN